LSNEASVIATMLTSDVLEAVQKYSRAGLTPDVIVAAVTPPAAAILMASVTQMNGGKFDVDAWNKAVQGIADAGVTWLLKMHPDAFRKEQEQNDSQPEEQTT
jgi:hypothetical protein